MRDLKDTSREDAKINVRHLQMLQIRRWRNIVNFAEAEIVRQYIGATGSPAACFASLSLIRYVRSQKEGDASHATSQTPCSVCYRQLIVIIEK